MNTDTALIFFFVIVAAATLLRHHYTKPFGLGSPLKATGRYRTWVNGSLREVWTVAFRPSSIRNRSTLVSGLAAEQFDFARIEERDDDLNAVLRDRCIRLPVGKTIQTVHRDGTVAAITVGRNESYHELHTQPDLSFSELDEFAVVPVELLSAKDRPPRAVAKATFG